MSRLYFFRLQMEGHFLIFTWVSLIMDLHIRKQVMLLFFPMWMIQWRTDSLHFLLGLNSEPVPFLQRSELFHFLLSSDQSEAWKKFRWEHNSSYWLDCCCHFPVGQFANFLQAIYQWHFLSESARVVWMWPRAIPRSRQETHCCWVKSSSPDWLPLTIDAEYMVKETSIKRK